MDEGSQSEVKLNSSSKKIKPLVPKTLREKPWPVIGTSVLVLLLLGTVGLLAYQNYQLKRQLAQTQPGLTSQTITIRPTPAATLNLNANWKLYSNSEIGISFKYPDYFEVTEWGPGPPESVLEKIEFRRIDSQIREYFFGVYSIGDASLDDWVQNNLNIFFPADMIKLSTAKVNAVTINKYEYIEATPDKPKSKLWFFSNKGRAFVLQIPVTSSDKEAIADQILLSLEFLD